MTTTLTVEGMCEQTVEEAVTEIEGVIDASADETTDTLDIEGNPSLDAVRTAVENAGYEPA